MILFEGPHDGHRLKDGGEINILHQFSGNGGRVNM